jgi:hypothetical protein
MIKQNYTYSHSTQFLPQAFRPNMKQGQAKNPKTNGYEKDSVCMPFMWARCALIKDVPV